ncbi:MAG: VacB/RNase II family 3'-5' exoribonuclease [Victivallales bacterium]|nr:VacB/RNase II family 3'-5' exoribonuclease [Victivallales bacterium]
MKNDGIQQNGLAKLRKTILDVVSSSPEEGFRRTDVRQYLGQLDEAFFKEAFKSLVDDGSLVKGQGGRFVTRESMSLVRGIIRINAKGFGFVTPQSSAVSGDVFIPPNSLCGAISGDEVLIEITSRDDPRGPAGLVRKITNRAHENFVGCLVMGDDGFEIHPLRRELPARLPVILEGKGDPCKGAKEGDWILAHIVPGRTPRSPLWAEIVKRIAKSGSVTSDLNAVIKEYELPKNYTIVDEKKLEGIQPIDLPREDLTDLTLVTIDPIDAKDYDDALSCMPGPQPGQVVVGVHIADVACYVTPDSPLDKKAYERGFTSYLPGKTIPMLPAILSSDLCSLRAHEKRLAHSVLLTVDEETGEVLQTRRVHSIICVTQRLTFEDVGRFLDGEAVPHLVEKVPELLQRLGALSQTIRRRRQEEEEFLPLQVAELRVLCGGNPPKVTDIVRIEPSPAHQLVEEFMLLANVAVGQEMLSRGILGLYRVHDEPDAKMLDDFIGLSSTLVPRKKKPKLRTRKNIVDFLEQIKGQHFYDLLCFNFLHCLPRAAYSTECSPHFGLGKPVYCHFTSPIRRYPDLFVHQQLIAADSGQPGRDGQFAFMVETTVNALEQNIDQACFAASDRLKLHYLDSRRDENPSELHEALVMQATPSGLVVYLPQYGLKGFIDRQFFRDGQWRFDPKSFALVNRRGGGQRYRCGDTLYVRIRSIDSVRGELELKPVQ